MGWTEAACEDPSPVSEMRAQSGQRRPWLEGRRCGWAGWATGAQAALTLADCTHTPHPSHRLAHSTRTHSSTLSPTRQRPSCARCPSVAALTDGSPTAHPLTRLEPRSACDIQPPRLTSPLPVPLPVPMPAPMSMSTAASGNPFESVPALASLPRPPALVAPPGLAYLEHFGRCQPALGRGVGSGRDD